MSKNFTITAENVLLNNPYGSSSVTIKNRKYADDILYKSKVNFKENTKHTAVVLTTTDAIDPPKFKFEINPDNPNQLVIYKKNGGIAMTLTD